MSCNLERLNTHYSSCQYRRGAVYIVRACARACGPTLPCQKDRRKNRGMDLLQTGLRSRLLSDFFLPRVTAVRRKRVRNRLAIVA